MTTKAPLPMAVPPLDMPPRDQQQHQPAHQPQPPPLQQQPPPAAYPPMQTAPYPPPHYAQTPQPYHSQPAGYAAYPPSNHQSDPRLPPRLATTTASQPGTTGIKRGPPTQPLPGETPPKKKQSKWTGDEDREIIDLRGRGMKWEDISKRLPGRSAISCRLRFQNYLERRSEWDEEKKNKLARLYERFKKDMWEKISKEMQLPWRAAEAMHWQIGEIEMAQRANVPVFHLAGQQGGGGNNHSAAQGSSGNGPGPGSGAPGSDGNASTSPTSATGTGPPSGLPFSHHSHSHAPNSHHSLSHGHPHAPHAHTHSHNHSLPQLSLSPHHHPHAHPLSPVDRFRRNSIDTASPNGSSGGLNYPAPRRRADSTRSIASSGLLHSRGAGNMLPSLDELTSSGPGSGRELPGKYPPSQW